MVEKNYFGIENSRVGVILFYIFLSRSICPARLRFHHTSIDRFRQRIRPGIDSGVRTLSF